MLHESQIGEQQSAEPLGLRAAGESAQAPIESAFQGA